ncbi:MAG: type II/IV secretion system protein [Comamonadaceae bacterium]|nr:MAG: type II/IV secretion system protein [Comamonadaceae bacterium]
MVSRGILDGVQLEYVRQKQVVSQQLLWRVLIQEGLASEKEVVRVLSGILGIEFVDMDVLGDPDPAVVALFNRELCLTSHFLPLRQQNAGQGKELVILLGDSLPAEVAQIVLRRTGMRCGFAMGQFSRVTQFIRNTYHFAKNPPEKLVSLEIARLADDRDHAYTPALLLDNLLHWAVRERATDIHITPGAKSLHVLFRIDGVLQPISALPLSLSRLLGYIKLISEMDISEQRRPQDGSFRASVLDSPLTVRVSTLVTEFGERTVLRLLPESHDVKDLESLGFFPEDVEVVARAMASPVGLVLITGPTGSGKSSTLHAGLRMQHLVERNVLTVEDPLEYRVPAAGQTEVNRRAGYDFSTALRHFLRHDPDVILVGEMRDAETAQAALDAAATGHLVLSTLHVTTVFGVVPRLRPMGLLPQVIAENLKLVINQRLVRRLCPLCMEDVPFTPAECKWLGLPEGAMGKCAKGCARCRQTGFYGRLPLYELLVIDEKLANAIADDVGREAIRSLAYANGFRTITEISRRRVALGHTTAEEVFRVTGEGPNRE